MDKAYRIAELAKAKDRADRESLYVYRPFPATERVHRSRAREIIIYGGKRASKSVTTCHEFGSRVTGLPIYGIDGNPLPRNYPVSTPDDPLLYWIIGWDVKHLSQTIYKLLFKKGMGGTLRAIKDEVTGQYRIWNRANPADVARKKESKLTEPVIPERLIKNIVWESESSNYFEFVELTNGARIYCYPSSARNPKQGDAVAGIWIDEDIQQYDHLQEWQDRLTDLNGWFMWSVWAHQKNTALEELLDRAEACLDDENPRVQAFQLAMTDNPFIPDDGKEGALARMGDAESIARRNFGDLGIDSVMMYDYQPMMHGVCPEFGDKFFRSAIMLKLLEAYKRFKKMPADWTRYMTIDPSFTRTAIHSWAVPPEEYDGVPMGNMAVCEWELVVKRFGPEQLASALVPKVAGVTYEAFIMDKQMGRQTRVGDDETVFTNYAEAFMKNKIRSRSTGEGFIPGCSVPPTRHRAVRKLMKGISGQPALYFIPNECPETIKEFKSYRRKTLNVGGETTLMDEPSNPRKHDCMASVEYFAAYIEPLFASGSAYVDPETVPQEGSPAYKAAMRALKKEGSFMTGGWADGYYGSETVHMGPGSFA